MKTLHVITEGSSIPVNLVLSFGQREKLLKLRDPSLIKKLAMEISLSDKNEEVIGAAVNAHRIYNFSAVGLCLAEDYLPPIALENFDTLFNLMTTGEVVIVRFELIEKHLVFNFPPPNSTHNAGGKMLVKRPSAEVQKE